MLFSLQTESAFDEQLGLDGANLWPFGEEEFAPPSFVLTVENPLEHSLFAEEEEEFPFDVDFPTIFEGQPSFPRSRNEKDYVPTTTAPTVQASDSLQHLFDLEEFTRNLNYFDEYERESTHYQNPQQQQQGTIQRQALVPMMMVISENTWIVKKKK